MEGCSFPRAFEKRENFLHLGKFFYEEFESYEKGPCKTGSSLHRDPAGETGGGSFYWEF